MEEAVCSTSARRASGCLLTGKLQPRFAKPVTAKKALGQIPGNSCRCDLVPEEAGRLVTLALLGITL